MARTSVPAARPGYLRQICLMVATLLLLAGLSGCGGESPEVLPPTAQAPAQETPLTPVLRTPSTAQAPAQETPQITVLRTPTTAQAPAQETPQITVLPTPTTAEELRSDRDRDKSPPATREDLRELVQGNNDFAFDLYRALSDEEGNLFYSPFSISQALAMTFAGARGETERQMADTLQYRLPQSNLHPAFNALDQELASRGKDRWGTPNQGEPNQYFRLNIANAVWGQHGFGVLPDFLDVLAENYGAGMRPLDFAGAPEESRARINDWVAEETEDKVKNLLPPGTIDPFTRLVLTNAIYFNASWHWRFNSMNTKMRPFRLEGGGSVDVPMMTETAKTFYGYAKGDGYQAVDVPYAWREMSMTVLLPDGGALGALEDSLNADLLDQIMNDIEIDYVTLTMPLFEFESEFSLVDTLVGMGMPDAFDGRADFSGMAGSKGLLISEVVHKAFVSVDERGTEAAASTAVMVQTSGPVKEPTAITVDRPFIFLIRDTATGTVLFLGRVMNPDAEGDNEEK